MDFDTNLISKAEFQYPIKNTVEHLLDAKFYLRFSYKNVDCKCNLWAMIKIILTFLKKTTLCKKNLERKGNFFVVLNILQYIEHCFLPTLIKLKFLLDNKKHWRIHLAKMKNSINRVLSLWITGLMWSKAFFFRKK